VTPNIKIFLLERPNHQIATNLLSGNLFTPSRYPALNPETKHDLIQVHVSKFTIHRLAHHTTSISKCRVLSRIRTYHAPAPTPRSPIQLGSEGRGSPRRNRRRNHQPSGQTQTKTRSCQAKRRNKKRTRTKSKPLIRALHGPISRCIRLNSFSTARSVTRSNAPDVLRRRL
jgi:hypothetical protein